MSWNRDTYDLIEDYLCGALKGSERADFESRLVSDAEFKEQFDLQKLTRDAIIIDGLGNVKSLMQKDLKPKRYWKLILIIGIVSLAAFGSWYYFKSNETQKPVKTDHVNHNKDVIIEDQLMDNEKNAKTDLQNNKPTHRTYQKSNANSENDEILVDSTQLDSIQYTKYTADNKTTSSTDTTNNNRTKSITPFDCSGTRMTALVHKSNPKYNETYGSISVSKKVIGGKSPFEFQLNTTGYQNEQVFKNVMPGTYFVIIKDANECVDTLQKVSIIKDFCRDDYIKSFAPESDYEWPIPSLNNKSGKFTLYSKGGTKVVEIPINSSNEMWLGTNNNNTNVPSGFYRFVIEYQDGTVCKGSVTVLR